MKFTSLLRKIPGFRKNEIYQMDSENPNGTVGSFRLLDQKEEEDDSLPFLSLPLQIQLRIFNKLPDYQTFQVFDECCKATHRLGEIDIKAKFLKVLQHRFYASNVNDLLKKEHCRISYPLLVIKGNDEEIIKELMKTNCIVSKMIIKSPRVSLDIFNEAIKRLELKSVGTARDYNISIHQAPNLCLLDRLIISGPFSDQDLYNLTPFVPLCVDLKGSLISSLGLILFCTDVLQGKRRIISLLIREAHLCDIRMVCFQLGIFNGQRSCEKHKGEYKLKYRDRVYAVYFNYESKYFLMQRFSCRRCERRF